MNSGGQGLALEALRGARAMLSMIEINDGRRRLPVTSGEYQILAKVHF
jgi:hypothetical protein